MGLRDRVLEWLGAADKASINERINRAYEAGYYDGNDDPAQGEFKAGGLGYRRISDRYVREGKIDFQRALETAWALWQKSPVAKRLLEIKTDHIIGHNAMPDTNDDELLPILTDFWNDNKLSRRSSQFTKQLFGFGEQCYPAFVRKSDGRVRLGYIDPGNIEKVIKHPDNTMENWAVCVKMREVGKHYDERLVYRIIRKDEDYVDEEVASSSNYPGKLVTDKQANLQAWESEYLKRYYAKSEYDGCCFYERVNDVSNQDRGMSDLLQDADYIDFADETLSGMADREQIANYFVVDVAVEGSPDEVKTRAKYYRDNPPKPGSVLVHNKNEEVNVKAPDLKQVGSIAAFRAILGWIVGGFGFPVHWYGFGDDANRATAVAQSDPTIKSLEHDQMIVEELFLSMLQFVTDQAEIANNYSPADDLEITLSLPQVSTKDMVRITQSMQALVQALINAQDARWISNKTAATAFAKLVAELDIQYDVMAELEVIAEEDETAELEREEQTNRELRDLFQQSEIGGNGQIEEEEMA